MTTTTTTTNATGATQPEPPYTPAQVLANLREMDTQLSGFPLSHRGPGWVRGACREIAERGIADPERDGYRQALETEKRLRAADVRDYERSYERLRDTSDRLFATSQEDRKRLREMGEEITRLRSLVTAGAEAMEAKCSEIIAGDAEIKALRALLANAVEFITGTHDPECTEAESFTGSMDDGPEFECRIGDMRRALK